MTVFAIVNPISGAASDTHVAARRIALLHDRFSAAGIRGEVHVTEGPRHALALATAALAGGVHTVLAWGGDGTVNEIGAALAGTNAALGIVPAGSGNGFAHALGIPRDPRRAIDAALRGPERLVDVGEVNGRPFFNIAGVGVDARIAARFNACARGRRGIGPYVRIGIDEAFRYRACSYDVELDGEPVSIRALVIAFANGREYGNGMCVARHARLDDGRLEAIVVKDRPPLARLAGSRYLLSGRLDKAPGVLARPIQRAEVRASGPLPFHVDGEEGTADRIVKVTIRPGYLRVRVPPTRRT